jgi:aspartyl-tRNA(Asn)/glutamyl-tRNA(Gln) amidotransferase subunit A
MHTLSLTALVKALHKRELSSTELTQHYLKRIGISKPLNAFISIDEEGALTAASKADLALKNGEHKQLTGIPVAHKDIFCTQSMPTTCGSKMLANFYSPYAATIVKRLEEQGCILLGKTNMDEFAMGSSNESSYFGCVKNPWDHERVPGGSSGGSAAAVAADLVPFATGSDTGGSIRQPAAFCGLSGIKPTYGLISRYGMVAYASSLDQAGAFAHSVEDLALILNVMAGFDERDSTSSEQPVPHYTEALDQPLLPLRIGLPSCFFHPDVSPDIQAAVRQSITLFEQAGATIIELDLSLQSLWVPCYYIIACAEASSNLSRYDGIRYGYRTPHADTLKELIARSRSEGFGAEVKRRILTGTHVLSSGYFHDYYVQAQKVRRMIQEELLHALSSVDIILGPTTPSPAFSLGEKIIDPTQRYLADIFTVSANLAGLPALSIPAGFSQGLPIGIQLMGAHFSESTLFRVAHYYQQSTHWHYARPRGDL